MKLPPCSLFVVLILISQAQATHYRVYLLGGQSNGNGRGDSAELSVSPLDVYGLDTPQTNVSFYWHKTQSTVAPNGTLTQDTWIDLQPGSGHGINSPSGHDSEFGSELSFGQAMAANDPSVNIAIIKYTHGGTNLHTQWSATGTNYATFLATIQAGLSALTESGHTYELGGMIWVQGEADTGLSNANNYSMNLTNLITRVRSDVGGLFANSYITLPFIISGLSDSQYGNITTSGSGPFIVRQAQETVAVATKQAAFVNTDGFSTYSNGNVHFDAAAQIMIGQSAATQMLALEAQDIDRDGLLSSEEVILGTLPDESDTDGDGFGDGIEVTLGTSPTNGADFFQISDFNVNTDGSVELNWPSLPGHEYVVERSTTLESESWSQISIITATGTMTNYIVPLAGSNSEVLAFYGFEGVIGGNFDTASYDSIDTESGTTAGRLFEGGSLTGGGANSKIINNSIFASSESGNNGLNLAGVNVNTANSADSFGFTLQSNGLDVTYHGLSFFHNQFGNNGKIDITYKIGEGNEQPILTGFVLTGGNALVTQEELDFTDFNTTSDVTFTFYLYDSSNANYGLRFDDIQLTGSVPNSTVGDAVFYRVRFVQ